MKPRTRIDEFFAIGKDGRIVNAKRRTLKMKVAGKTRRLKLKKVDLNIPLVKMTPEERAEAAESMRVFREEDR